MNMYAKVLVSMLATALLPLLLVSFVIYQSSKSTLVAMAGNALETGALTLTRAATTLVESAAKEVESWAALDTLQTVFTGEDIDLRMSLLLRELQANSDFVEIWCADASGKIVAASNYEQLGHVVSGNEAVGSALAGVPGVSPVQAFSGAPGPARNVVCIAYPLRGAFDDETLIGVIVGFYNWDRVGERVSFQERIAAQDGMHLFLLDGARRVIAKGKGEPALLSFLDEIAPPSNSGRGMPARATSLGRAGGSRQILRSAAGQGWHPNMAYTGVAMAPEASVLRPVHQLAWFALLACCVAVAAILIIALYLSRLISRPVSALSSTARQIAQGNLELAPPVLSGDEIGQLAADLDVMRQSLKRQINTLDTSVRERTEQLEDTVRQLQGEIQMRERAQAEASVRERQLRQADKMISLGILVSGVAHEINNPNGLIGLNVGLLAEIWGKALPVLDAYFEAHGDFSLGAMNYSEFREQMPVLLADTAASSERIKAIVDDLKGFSRTSDERLDEIVDVNRMVQAAVNLVSNHLKKATRHLDVDLAPDLPAVRGNERRLEQVAINLLLNACDALESPEAAIRIATRAEDRQVIVEVADEGRGIAPADLPHVTDPFFTTRRNAGGTGLGLSVSAGIIEEHGGALRFSSEPGGGVTARIVLPVRAGGEET